MNLLHVTRKTTDAEILAFCEANPGYCRKTVMAQAKHERRLKRIAHRKQAKKEEQAQIPWQYRHSIFDRSQSW